MSTLEDRKNYSTTLGDYYRDLSYWYHEYSSWKVWPSKPKNPFKRSRSEAQLARQERVRREKWLAKNGIN